MDYRANRALALPLTASAIVAGLFLVFVYIYPRLLPAIQFTDPANFEEAIGAALEQGEQSRALKIARKAVRARPADPAAYVAYAQQLSRSGRHQEAMATLDKLFSLRRTIESPEGPTYKPYYLASGRLLRARIEQQTDAPVQALSNVLLAEAYADIRAPRFAEYHSLAADLFMRYGFWNRALQMRNREQSLFKNLAREQLIKLGYVLESEGVWNLLDSVTNELTSPDVAALAQYFRGRIALAREDFEEAVQLLENSLNKGYNEAAFYLALAHERSNRFDDAFEAYAMTSPTSVFRPIALGKMATLLDRHGITTNATAEELREQLTQSLDGPYPIHDARQHVAYPAHILEGVRFGRPYFDAGGRFPIAMLWTQTGTLTNGANHPLRITQGPGDSWTLAWGTKQYQVVWRENKVNWSQLSAIPGNTQTVPGWIDVARDWAHLQSQPSVRIDELDAGAAMTLVSNDSKNFAWAYSVPTDAAAGHYFLLAGKIKSTDTPVSLGLEALDWRERVNSAFAAKDVRSDTWRWFSVYGENRLFWEKLRVRVGFDAQMGEAHFDDILLVEFPGPPAP